MTQENKKQLDARWSALDANERNKLLKRAALLRKKTQARTIRQPYDIEEANHDVLKRRGPTLQELALKLMLQDEAPVRDAAPTGVVGQILSVAKGQCQVQLGDRTIVCRLSPELIQVQQTAIAVGDRVVLSEADPDEWVVEGVMPRSTFLSRPDPVNEFRERVVVANVDVIAIVVSVVTPPLHPRLIDRYLVAIQRGGARPMIAVNKIDLLEDRSELEKLAPYHRLGLNVVECSAVIGRGIEELRRTLSGTTCAFVGHSGVGKSALVNALKPDLGLKTGDVSAGYGRGTHTTTASTMWDLGDGTRIVDTPGIRSFGLFKMKADELILYFDDINALASGCKYRDCTHSHEPSCAVKTAVESEDLDRDRYDTYFRLRDSL